MIQLVFMRLPQFSASSNLDADSNLSSETLTLKKRTNSAKRDRQNIKNERSQSQGIESVSIRFYRNRFVFNLQYLFLLQLLIIQD